jgi:hypothetical protein
MGSRFGRVLLIAAAVLIVLGGGAAAALLATSDDADGGSGESIQLGGSVGTGDAPEPTESTAATEAEPPTTPTETDASAGEPPKAEDTPATGGAPRKTRFPRERKQTVNNDPPERVFTVPPAREFTGNGNATLGTVNLSRAAVVKWTTTGRFELRFGRESFPIIAPSPSGQLAVPPYNFEQVRVIAKGRWTITITPQK